MYFLHFIPWTNQKNFREYFPAETVLHSPDEMKNDVIIRQARLKREAG